MKPIRTPPHYCWWKPEASDPAQFKLTVPHWLVAELASWSDGVDVTPPENPRK